MTLGERCDEIVRLIDETLDGLAAPAPRRRRRATTNTLRPVGPVHRPVDGLGADPDAGPTAA